MAGQTPGGGGSGFADVTEVAEDGFLIGVSVFTPADSQKFFQTFVTVDLMRGGDQADNRVFQLASGYVSNDVGLSNSFFLQTRTEDFLFMRVRGNIDPAFHVKYFYLDRRLERGLIALAEQLPSTP